MIALPARAFPVQAPFGSDSFPKAIVFTSANKPVSSHRGALSNLLTGAGGGARESGVIMTPVGDGSYACTMVVFPGATYTYYFPYRIKEYESDSNISFMSIDPVGNRTMDASRAKSITIPSNVVHGFYIYNAFGDVTVLGHQAASGSLGDTDVLSTLNPFIASLPDTPGCRRLNISGDTVFANYAGDNPYNFDAVQTGDSAFTLTWEMSMGADGFIPTIEGARRFGGGGIGGSPQYGYRIWRCDSPAGGVSGALFVDRTREISGVFGSADTNFSDNNTSAFDAVITAVDTSIPDTASTYLYLVTFHNAYNYFQSDTTRENFAGGYDTVTRSQAARVFFIVEHYDENVVFPRGRKTGRVYLTPYIDGVRRAEERRPAGVIRVRRSTEGPAA